MPTTYTPPKALTPSWWVDIDAPKPAYMSLSDYMTTIILNRAIPFLDPVSQAETAQFLMRRAPTLTNRYKSVLTPTTEDIPAGASLQQQAQRLATGADYLNVKNLGVGLRPEIIRELNETPEARAQSMGDIRFLGEALSTAREGLPKVGASSGASRAQQQFAQQHLKTLMDEAMQNRDTGFAAFLENLTNPVLRQAPLSGIFGVNRAQSLPGGSDYRRGGVAFRNPGLT
jgi:hypothetical protein